MHWFKTNSPGRRPAIAVAALTALLLLVMAAPAMAHDPIFLTEDQTSPETGPYLPDGTISFAVYGTLLDAGDTRGLEFDLRDGDDLYLSLLIPDLEPEVNLPDAELPTMTLVSPDGSSREIGPDMRSPFADPFSGTNYVTLYETVEPADGGRHQLLVTGTTPTRFVVAVGTREEFFTPTERSGDRPNSFPGIAAPLNEWYTTSADGTVQDTAAEGDGVDIDVDLVEEELAKLAEEESAESGPADDAEGDSDGEAAAPAADTVGSVGDDGDGENGSATTWIAPAAVAVAAIGGGAVYFRRRETA